MNCRVDLGGPLFLLIATLVVRRPSIVPALPSLDIFHGMGPHPLSGIVVAMVDEFELERWSLIQPKSWRLPGGGGHDSCGVQCGWNGALLGIEFMLRSDESMKVGVYAGGKKPREANGDVEGPSTPGKFWG